MPRSESRSRSRSPPASPGTASSPRARGSLRKHSSSPPKEARTSSSPKPRSPSPKRASSPKRRSRSPPKKRSRSPPQKRSRSPPKRSRSSPKRSRSPPRRRERSPPRRRRSPPRGNNRNRRGPSPEPTRILGVFGLSNQTDERDLRKVFDKFGAIEKVQLIYDKQTNRSKGFAFIYYDAISSCTAAKDECNDMKLDNRSIRTDYSLTRGAHAPTPGKYLGRPTTPPRDGDRDRSPRRESPRRGRSPPRRRDRSPRPRSPPRRRDDRSRDRKKSRSRSRGRR